MGEIKLTAAQIAVEIGETVYVVRNWIKDFKPYLKLEKSESGYNLFTQDSTNVMMRIKKMSREQNLSVKQIQAVLSGADKPSKNDKKDIEIMQDFINRQTAFNQAVLEKMDEQSKMIEQVLKQRDEKLMLGLHEIRDRRKWWQKWLKS